MQISLFSQLVRQSESGVGKDLTSDDISGSRQGAPKSSSYCVFCLKAFLCMPGEVCQKERGLKSGHILLGFGLGLRGTRQHRLGVNMSSRIYRCQPLVIHTPKIPPEPKVKCRSAHQTTILHRGQHNPQGCCEDGWGHWLGKKQRIAMESWEEYVLHLLQNCLKDVHGVQLYPGADMQTTNVHSK